MRFSALLIFSAMAFAVTSAHAHWGHVGELAGHGHLIGIGALVGAAALAAALRKPKNSDDGDVEPTEEEIEAEGETA